MSESLYMNSHPYFGIFLMIFIVLGIFFNITNISRKVGKKLSKQDTQKLKLSTYECGPKIVKQGTRLPIQFYSFALLFILFDVEVVFMLPWAINFEALGWFGFFEMLFFIFLLALGYVYAWKKGALEWHTMK